MSSRPVRAISGRPMLSEKKTSLNDLSAVLQLNHVYRYIELVNTSTCQQYLNLFKTRFKKDKRNFELVPEKCITLLFFFLKKFLQLPEDGVQLHLWLGNKGLYMST